MSSDNLALWKSVEKTDPDATKPFQRGGGYKGTAIKPMYLIKKATQQWGPIGARWGCNIVSDELLDGSPIVVGGAVVGHTKIHKIVIDLWYPSPDGTVGHAPGVGVTEFCGQRRSGDTYTDEEAPKKSLTDALTKALSWLGFAADVHMGRFDDTKYVDQVRDEMSREHDKAEKDELRGKALQILDVAVARGSENLRLAWESISTEMRLVCKNDLARLKAEAAKHDKKELVNA